MGNTDISAIMKLYDPQKHEIVAVYPDWITDLESRVDRLHDKAVLVSEKLYPDDLKKRHQYCIKHSHYLTSVLVKALAYTPVKYTIINKGDQ